jgi:hypothetical protein
MIGVALGLYFTPSAMFGCCESGGDAPYDRLHRRVQGSCNARHEAYAWKLAPRDHDARSSADPGRWARQGSQLNLFVRTTVSTLRSVRDGSISRIRRDGSNDRDVRTVTLRTPMLDARFVADAAASRSNTSRNM